MSDKEYKENRKLSRVRRIDYDEVEFDDQLALVDQKPFSGIIYSVFPNGGQLESETNYVDGLPEGPMKEWYPSGQIKSDTMMRRGQGSSESEEWYENGKRKSYRKNADHVGLWIELREWDIDGNIVVDEKRALPDWAD